MSSNVTANFRTVVHRGDGHVNVSAAPDVCKTPSPGGPVPVPYPNIASDSDLDQGTKDITIAGNPVAHARSCLSRSSGDEAGTAGGIISGSNRGKLTWGTSSGNVLVEGEGVVRFADLTHHNNNTFNTLKMQDGSIKVVINYGDDKPCPICEKSAPPHPLLSDEAPDCNLAKQKMSALIAKLPREDNGYMVAIVVCECRQTFAARSQDPQYPSSREFRDFAAEEGHKTEKWVRSPVRDLLRKNFAAVEKARPGARLQKLVKHIERLDARIDSLRDGRPIGQCAGPRALALAIQLGHRPYLLCERWRGAIDLRPDKLPTVDYKARVYKRFHLSQRPENLVESSSDWVTRAFSDGENVPSCNTCKLQIPALLCRDLPPCTK